VHVGMLPGYCCAHVIKRTCAEAVLSLMRLRCCMPQATMAPMFNIWHTTLGDDSDMSEFLCPQVVSCSSCIRHSSKH
jgi:hypothetical protein